MNIEEAITTALKYEREVHATYAHAAEQASDATASKVFATMAKEELGHIAYLESRLDEWQRTGSLTPAALATVFVSKERLGEAVGRLHGRAREQTAGSSPEIAALKQALKLEEETSAFYERMVAELPPAGQALFARFVEVEKGHTTIVQAEIDYVLGNGFWFDVMEFSLEAG